MHIRWEEISRSAVIVDGTVSNKLGDAEYTIFQEWTNTVINISSTWKVNRKPSNHDSECIKRHQKAIYPSIFKIKAICVDVAALGIVNNAWRRRSDNDYNSLVEQFGDWLYAINGSMSLPTPKSSEWLLPMTWKQLWGLARFQSFTICYHCSKMGWGL